MFSGSDQNDRTGVFLKKYWTILKISKFRSAISLVMDRIVIT